MSDQRRNHLVNLNRLLVLFFTLMSLRPSVRGSPHRGRPAGLAVMPNSTAFKKTFLTH